MPDTSKADALIGQTIDGRYRIESKLGSGGMGAVYRASRLLIGDEVAIKILHAEQLADPRAIERFRREAQAAARLKHPNVVTIYDFGILGDGTAYLVMELLEGQSLRRLIEQQAPIAPSVAAEIISQICAALDEAHRHNVIHRDLKPDNIIVNRTPAGLRVKVLDFGIAKLRDASATIGTLTQTGAVIGTPHYMSPEQCSGEELDGRSDIYSLGIVLYEMLTGKVPFDSTTPTSVVIQHVTKAPPPFRQFNASVPPAVERVVMRALEKNRDARQQTARALTEELFASLSAVDDLKPTVRQQVATDEMATIRTPRGVGPAPTPPQIIPPPQAYGGPQQWMSPVMQQRQNSRGVKIVIVVTLVIAILGAAGVLGYVYLFKKDKEGSADSLSSGSRASATASVNSNVSQSARNSNKANMNVTVPPVTGQNELPPTSGNPSTAKEQVMATLQGWADAMRRHDFESSMSYYADTLDIYYGRANVSLDAVRADRVRAFQMFSSMNVQLRNFDIVIDPQGARAVATFDKTWTFSGNRYSEGSVQARMWLANIGGRWRITGEKDLQVYYKR
ncbi:MAG TPA: protein kinase [Blastocatellia bacterium]|nr:protein kinase [Blastocatellia bacterium]